MNKRRAQELIVPLRKGTADGISEPWRERLIEALEYVIEHEPEPTGAIKDLRGCRVMFDLTSAYDAFSEMVKIFGANSIRAALAEIEKEVPTDR